MEIQTGLKIISPVLGARKCLLLKTQSMTVPVVISVVKNIVKCRVKIAFSKLVFYKYQSPDA